MSKNPETPSTAASDGTIDTAPSPPSRSSSQNVAIAENTSTQQSNSPTRRTAGRTNPSASTFLAAHQPSGMAIIRQAYGPDADLYRDVLFVDPSASDREVRMAYFRRGKKVLSKPDDVPGVDNKQDVLLADTPSIAAVSHGSKLQFQAVSNAYDILSDPGLRSEYDATGTVADNSSTTASPVMLKAPSKDGGIGSVKMQRSRSQNTPYRKKKTSVKDEGKQSVRWSKTVEELVIQNDCVSIASRRSWNCGGSLDSVDDGDGDGGDVDVDDDNASVTSIDSAASSVKQTLRRLDDNAETFTRQEFLDELAFSVQSLLHAASRDITDVVTSGNLSDDTSTKKTDKKEGVDNDSKSSVRRRLSLGFKKDNKNKKEADGTNLSTTDKEDDRSSSLLGTVLTIGNSQPKKATSSASPTSVANSSNKGEATSRDVPASATTATDTKADDEKDKQSEIGSSDDFYLYLSTYICGAIQEIKGSLDHVGSMCSDGTCSGVIQEQELDSLVHMLRNEVEQQEDHPFDEPETTSPLGTTIETFDTESVPSTLAMERNDVEAAPVMA